MAVTTYTYSVADDTANGAVHPRSLDAEIRASTIVTALDGIATAGDVLSIKMKDALSSSDETTLDGLVEAHQGVVTVNLPPPTNSKGAPVFRLIGVKALPAISSLSIGAIEPRGIRRARE